MRLKTGASAAVLAALLSTAANADSLISIGAGNRLVTFDSATPGTVGSSIAVTGLATGTTLGGIDYRPASSRVLYGISNTGQLYAINARTGVAAAVGATPALPTIAGTGFDFNPTVDRIRVITQIGQDARINPDTGALAATDGTLAYATGDANAGQLPTAAGAAYTNPFAGAATTTLYVIDTRSGLAAARLVTQGNLAGTVSPNTGQLFTVGSTGVTSLGNVGFDISRTGTAYATLTNPTTRATSLYSINLATGAATLIGALSGNTTYEGLAIQLASFTSMGTTANQAAVGQTLDNFASISDASVLGLLNGIDSRFASPGAQAAALQALSPAAFSMLPELSLNAVETQETNVLRYTRDLRGNATMPYDATTLDGAGKVGIWGVSGARTGHYDAAADRNVTGVDELHVLGGIDYRFAPKIALGAYGGYSHVKSSLAPGGGGRGYLDSWFAGGYGTASIGPAYVDLWGSYTDLDWTLRRSLAIGTFTGRTAADTDGRIYAGGAATGLAFKFGVAEIEPFAALRYANVRIDGFTETGSVAALAVGSVERTSVRSNAGARVGASIPFAGAIVRPQLRGSWYHEFRDKGQLINAAFVNGGIGTPFSFRGTPLSNEYFNAGAALNIAGNGPLSLVADYDLQFDDDRRIHAVSLGVRFAL